VPELEPVTENDVNLPAIQSRLTAREMPEEESVTRVGMPIAKTFLAARIGLRACSERDSIICNYRTQSGAKIVATYSSQAQIGAEKIREATLAVAKADAQYRRGGSLDKLNAANAELAACHNRLYEIDGGVVPDERQ
jgi:hypothetical protein